MSHHHFFHPYSHHIPASLRRLTAIYAILLVLVTLPIAGNAGPAAASAPAAAQPHPHPILNDVRVRRAIAYCTNKDALIASVYPELTAAERQSLVMNTFIAPFNWAYTPPSTQYNYDPAAGAALLDQAGWFLAPGQDYREKEQLGQLTLSLSTTNAQFRQTFLTVFEAQMKACGIRLIRIHAPADWVFGRVTGKQVRDFELSDFAWASQEDPGGRTLYACDQIPLPSNGWSGQNDMGWCNPTASEAIKKAADTNLSQAERKGYYATVIEAMAADVPSLPLFMRTPVDPGNYTWEHIDFNLESFSESISVPQQLATTGQFTDFDGDTTTVFLPLGAGAVAPPAIPAATSPTLTYAPLVEGQAAPTGPRALKALRLSASVDNVPAPETIFNYPVTISISYTDAEVNTQGLRETSLLLYAPINGSWQDATNSCPEAVRHTELDTQQNRVMATVCAVGEFTVRGAARKTLYLPLLSR